MESTKKNKVYQFKCTICTASFKYPSFLSNHMERRHLPPKYKCEICSKLFKRKDGKLFHIRTVHLKEKPHSCPIKGCNAQFVLNSVLQNHINSIHCSEEEKQKFSCPKCPKGFTTKSAQKNHFDNVHLGQGHHCPIEHCDYSGNDKTSLKRHLVRHTQEKAFHCGTCPLKFKCATDLKKHEKMVHSPNSRKYACEKCPKSFKRPAHLKGHMKIHSKVENREQFPCSQCSNKFLSMRSLDFHFQLHHQNNLEKQNCPFPDCQKVFPCSQYLKIHIKFVHTPNNEECYFCKRMFSTGQRRDNHMKRIHLLERAYICPKEGCGKSFATTNELKGHEKYYHKSQRCKKCQKSLPSRNALKDHIDHFHISDMKHKCTICGRRFGRFDHFNDHIRSVHTKENPFKCKDCNFEGSRSTYLILHRKKVHPQPMKKN